MADNYFCLDIGEKNTKIVDARKIGDMLEINSIDKAETNQYYYTTEEEKNVQEQANLINKLVTNLKIIKKNVNVIIPDSLTYSQILMMPNLNEKELISAIKYQADQFIPMPIEEINIDIEVIEEYKSEKKILILIVAAPKKLIEKIQTTVELAGLIPLSVETELSANSRFVMDFANNFPSMTKENFLLLNLDLKTTNLSFFEQGKTILRESHNFSLGYQLFLKEIQVNTNVSVNQAGEILKSYTPDHPSSYPVETILSPLLKELVSEIKRFTNNHKLDNLYFINNIVNVPSLAALVSKELSIPATIYNPLSFIKKTPMFTGAGQELPLFISTFGGNLR